MLPVFKDQRLQAQFNRDGFVKLNLLSSSQISELRNYYDEVRLQHEGAIQEHCLYSSTETGDPDLLITVDKLMKKVIMKQVELVFQNYQTLISSYLIKDSGDDTELMPHQDLSFVSEPEQCSFNIWIPLQKTDNTSGQLRILKGSHRIRETLRVVPKYPRPFVQFQDTIRDLFTDIETEIGECVVINHAVIHGSTVNLTGEPRVAVILGMCSAPADIHYYYMPDGDNTKIEKYQMTPEDYYYFKPDGRPLKAKLKEIITYPFEPTTEQTFREWIKRNSNMNLWTKLNLLYFKSMANT